ncbi:class II aaRS and biotin synthetase [Stipitochalara longipes BDJ]|nr:class II aaRS and biotin synthetase [Stipitochalara longipes BDJ]
MNVIIYTGPGAVTSSATHNLAALRRLLFPHYAVAILGTEALLRQPWSGSCALLVFPEGYGNQYPEALGTQGRADIVKYVKDGGKLLAIGDGVEPACGGEKKLGFYKGGWTRESEDTKEKIWATVNAEGKLFRLKKVGKFKDSEGIDANTTTIMGTFVDQAELCTSAKAETPAVLYITVGNGAVLLASVDLSCTKVTLASDDSVQALTKNLNAVNLNSAKNEELLRAYIGKLGLKLGEGGDDELQLSAIHISSITPPNAQKLKDSWHDLILQRDETEYIVDMKDTFRIETVTTEKSTATKDESNESSVIVDPSRGSDLSTLIHVQGHPSHEETPFFDHGEFYVGLRQRRSVSAQQLDGFGSYLMYGQVMTSTNTILERNQKLLHHLPTGFTVVATRQTQGRGRSANVWLSPSGCLLFSVCVRHPVNLMQQAHPLFIQYIASIAVVEAVKSYGEGCNDVHIRLKWPNDIYVEDPATLGQNKFVKIGGILVQCSGDGKEYYLVVGIGFNVTNAAPTTSINHVIEALNHRRNANGQESLKPYTQETLLARILVTFEELHTRFCNNGWDKYLEDLYHKMWLHRYVTRSLAYLLDFRYEQFLPGQARCQRA